MEIKSTLIFNCIRMYYLTQKSGVTEKFNYSVTPLFLLLPFIKTKEPVRTKISPINNLIVKFSLKIITDKIDPNIGINNLNTPNWFAL